jgi:ATP-binding cassette, subfamily B (MDR/TAP), member 1
VSLPADYFLYHTLYRLHKKMSSKFFSFLEVSCWILTGERQTAVIRSKYVQVLLNQDMSFFDTYGNNGDIVSQVLSDVLLIQSALSEKVSQFFLLLEIYLLGVRAE